MRLGDDIDDYCTRCKRSTDHSIAAVVGDEVQKVMCRICHTEHPYRHNDSGKPTKEQALEKRLANAKDQVEGSTAGLTDSTGDAELTEASATGPATGSAEAPVNPTGAATKTKRTRKRA